MMEINGTYCDIIIPVWNRLDDTKECLDNIFKNTGYPYRLIIIDNASGPDTEMYLKRLASYDNKITLIRNGQNTGFVRAVNQGLSVSKAPYVCLLNNDTVPAKGWLEELIRFAEENPDVGLLNPLCKGHGADAAGVNEYARNILSDRGKYMEMNQCQGYCMVIKRALIDKIGWLDERFGLGGFDDTDYSMRAHLEGYRSVCVYSSYVYHKEHMSFNDMGDRKKIQAEAEKAYYAKWPRHLRAVMLVSEKDLLDGAGAENMLSCAVKLAREWCWINIWVIGEKGSGKIIEDKMKAGGIPLHQNIKLKVFSLICWQAQVFVRLLSRSAGRKPRKKIDLVIFNDKKLKLIAAVAGGITGAKVFCLRDIGGKSDDWPSQFSIQSRGNK